MGNDKDFGKAPSRGVLVISCLAGLYATVTLEVGLQWYYTSADLSSGASRLDIYKLILNDDRSRSISILQQISVPLGPIFADGLMVSLGNALPCNSKFLTL